MASNYDSIRADNIREYGEGTRHLAFLGRLYTDRTHFIFELLQNAEDAAATTILFELFEDRLEVKHDGRPFNERDVRGVCGVGEGMKAEDLTQIGKFGIGFKSVYAYTSAPEVHSVDEHFRIEHYVRPFQAVKREPGGAWTTLFVFPFDRPDLEADVVWQEIARRLQEMSARTLLFLRKIKEIEYRLPDEKGGFYLRQEVDRGQARQVTVIGQNDDEEEEETWLVFERLVSVPDSSDEVPVEIGFKLESRTKDQGEHIIKINESPLVVSFPTEKSTRFGFLIQGPYRTTPSRDNIPKNDNWNTTLVKETATLTTLVLNHLKAMGLLTVSLLEALPIRTPDFPKDGMFFPIVAAVRAALIDQDLLPADDGSFVSAGNAKLARGVELRKLLPNNLLRALLQTENEVKWLSGEITQDRTPDLRKFLMSELGVGEIDPDDFARRVSKDFLNRLDDEWFARFYEFLLNQEALWRCPKYDWETPGILRSKTILRLENGSLVTPFNGPGGRGKPNAYLPVEHETRFASVRRTIAGQQSALDFLRRLGLSEPDETADVIENILPKYNVDAQVQIGEEEYQSDLQAIFNALNTDPQQKRKHLLEEAKKTPFVKAINAATGESSFKKPGESYLPTKELSLFFGGNPQAWFVDRATDALYHDDLAILGSRDMVRPSFRAPNYDGYVRISSDWGYHKRGIDGFDPDATIEGLEFALRNPTYERSRFIWSDILISNVRLLVGSVETATRQDYSNGETHKERSHIGNDVVNFAWVPTWDNQWKKPGEIRRDELHPDLTLNDSLLEAIGVKPSAEASVEDQSQNHALHTLGLTENDLDAVEFVRSHPDAFAEFKQRIESQACTPTHREKPDFPVRVSVDPERRDVRLAEQHARAADKEYEQREISVRTTRACIEPAVWLRTQYTNEEQQLVCQICKEEMPFRKRDGEYYFEAVEALGRDDFPKEHEAQFLALCPLCAAMYTEFVKRDEGAMSSFKNALLSSVEPEIPLQLGTLATSVRFVDIHFRDLKTIIGPD